MFRILVLITLIFSLAFLSSKKTLAQVAPVIPKAQITMPGDTGFKFYAFKKMPPAFKTALAKIPTLINSNLLKDINEYITNECEVKVAAIDLNENGIYGFIVSCAGTYCCGSAGCAYDIYEDGGTLAITLNDYEVSPGKGGVKSSANKIIEPRDNPAVKQNKSALLAAFAYDKKAQATVAVYKNVGNGGGKTGDELGRKLLTALKTNNLQLWMSCMHPNSNAVTQEFNAQRFQQFRQWMEEDGVSDWSKVIFNRVTYHVMKVEPKETNGEKILQFFVIEFDYQNKEFLGAVGSMSAQTLNKGNYLVWFPGKDTALRRRPKNR